MQQINFTGDLTWEEGARMYFVIEEMKETVLDFSYGTVKGLRFYYIWNVKLSNSHLNKLKSGIKNETKATLNLSLILDRNSNVETNFLHKSLLTNIQV